MEQTVRIENRAQLIYLLTEAAELEHSIMCCYLFAAFSLKSSVNEGVTQPQLDAIRRWRRLLRQISIEEMLHLGAACNLLTAVGGAPQMRRPNLPLRPKAYGATFRLQLAPFTLETIESFIEIERPLAPEVDRRLPSLVRPRLSDIFSSERPYDTQGKLYRGIEDGVRYLAQKYGDEGLFIGPHEAQTTSAYFDDLTALTPVTDLASALAAIDIIVTQGEGASFDSVDSHYHKFVTIYEEYKQVLAEDPDFVPARPVLPNPYAMLPADLADAADVHEIDDPDTQDYCNLFDALYELMVQMLGRLFVHAEESEDEFQRLTQTTEGLMMEIIAPLGNLITTLPAGPSHPGRVAGPSFRLSRGASIPSHREPAWRVFHERLMELHAYCRFLQSRPNPPPALTRVMGAIVKYAGVLKPAASG